MALEVHVTDVDGDLLVIREVKRGTDHLISLNIKSSEVHVDPFELARALKFIYPVSTVWP